ncbi:transcriptional repressor TraM [Devosia sp. LjRoot3]|uniref:transcriptional repressor TraM n=1 Tax=Devosia sp. LjRoot3 TaxID=3342319 RepID=UPI003F509B02
MKPVSDIRANAAPSSSTIESVLRDLTTEELKRLAVSVIREHRSRLQVAQELFEEIERLKRNRPDETRLDLATNDYRCALLCLDAQHHVVRTIIARLGYVPIVDGQTPTLN